MLIVCSGDFQAAVSNLDRCSIIAEQIIDILKSTKDQKFFIHTGDSKEHTNPVDQRVTNFIIESFTRIKEHCTKVFFVRGNHDSIAHQDGVPSIAPLICALGVHVADSTWDYCNLDANIRLYLVPYFRDLKTQASEFKGAYTDASGSKKKNILVFHNEIAGCDRTAYSKGEGLTLKDIGADHYDFCISGHIHNPHEFGKVWFAGSPFCCDFGEVNQRKSLLCLHINEKGVIESKRIPSRIPGWYDPKAPGFVPPKDWKGSRVRITVPVSLDPLKELEEARKRLEIKYSGAILNLIPDYQKLNTPTSSPNLKGDDETILQSYLQKTTLPEYITVDQVIVFLKKFLPSFSQFGVQGIKLKSFEAVETLSFQKVELDLTRTGMTLVTGKNLDWGENISNGAGKSAMLTIPFLALFGKTFKEQIHDGWARQETTASAAVKLKAELPDSSQLLTVRGRRPSFFRVYQNSKEISMGDSNATQKMLEQLTNLTWDVVTNSTYIGQHEIGSVFGTEKQRKELFSHLLGLDRFLLAQSKIQKIVLKCNKSINAVELEIDIASAALQEAKNNYEDVLENLKATPEIDDRELRGEEWNIQGLEAQIRANDQTSADIQATLDVKQKNFETYLHKGLEAEAEAKLCIKQLNESLKVNGNCPLCGSWVSVKTLGSHLAELQRRQKVAENQVERYEELQTKNRRVCKVLIERIQQNRQDNLKIQKSIDTFRENLAKRKAQADERKRLQAIVTDQELRVRQLERTLSIHRRALMAYQEERLFLETCSYAVSRNGLPAFLCSLVAPQLNEAAVRYSQIFSEGEIGLQFEIADGDIDVNICNLHGGKGFKDQSDGETVIAAAISAFSFREVLVGLNILVLDEPGNGLDSENAARFAKGLNQIKDRFGSLFVITHNPYILAGLEPDYHLEVVKKNGISVVNEITV